MTTTMVTNFLMEECIASPMSCITSFALYQEFDRWCRAKSIPYYIQTPNALTRTLHKLGIKTKKNGGFTAVIGITLRQSHLETLTVNHDRPMDPLSALAHANRSNELIPLLQIVTKGKIFS
jgi:Na+-translocating ferredoxin:NAD+ oxidoreductase RnfC subunit